MYESKYFGEHKGIDSKSLMYPGLVSVPVNPCILSLVPRLLFCREEPGYKGMHTADKTSTSIF